MLEKFVFTFAKITSWSFIFLVMTGIVLFGETQQVMAAPPANDNFSHAIPITQIGTEYIGSNIEATTEPDEPNHYGELSNSVWWSFTAPQDGNYTISNISFFWPLKVLSLYYGTTLANLELIYRAEGYGHPTLSMLSGQRVYIALDGRSRTVGDVGIQVNGPYVAPVNDNFADASELTDLGVVYSGTNFAATVELDEPDYADNASHSVWWRFTVPRHGEYTISTLGSDFNTVLWVYSGTKLEDLVLVAHNDDADINIGVATSKVATILNAGEQIYIAIDGDVTEIGNIQLTVERVSGNSAFIIPTISLLLLQ